MSNVYDFTATSLSGQPVALDAYKGKVLLIVNTASACGFTPQYAGLEKIYQELKDMGLVVLGFPCNQFGHQEPGNATEIGAFCEKNFGVTFPLFEKINVNGSDAHPLYQFLKSHAPGVLGSEGIKWNFTKFLVKKDGTVFGRYASLTKPEDMVDDVKKLLAE
jgi:glutathione peroxidase